MYILVPGRGVLVPRDDHIVEVLPVPPERRAHAACAAVVAGPGPGSITRNETTKGRAQDPNVTGLVADAVTVGDIRNNGVLKEVKIQISLAATVAWVNRVGVLLHAASGVVHAEDEDLANLAVDNHAVQGGVSIPAAKRTAACASRAEDIISIMHDQHLLVRLRIKREEGVSQRGGS